MFNSEPQPSHYHCLSSTRQGSMYGRQNPRFDTLSFLRRSIYQTYSRVLFFCSKKHTVTRSSTHAQPTQASFFLGDVGAGSKMKLAVNMVMGEMLCALGEGIHLADRAALNPSTLVEILGLGAMACPLVAGKGPAMAAGGPFPTAFPLKHQLKDVSESIFTQRLVVMMHTKTVVM